MKKKNKITKLIIAFFLIISTLIINVLPFYASNSLTDEENEAFLTRKEFNAWAEEFFNTLNNIDMISTSRIYADMDFYDMKYRFTEKYKGPQYIDENGQPTSKLKRMIAIEEAKRQGNSGTTPTPPPTPTLLYRAAIISDEHVPSSYSYSKANDVVALANLKNSYNCSFIISCGDHTGNGSTSQWSEWLSVVDASPWDRGDIHSCTGNHEVYDHTQVTTLLNRFKQYDNAGKYNSSSAKPYFYEDIGGDRFIFMALEGGGDTPDIRDEFTDAQLTFVQNAIDSYTGSGFVWIVEHSLFKGWGSGDNPSRVAYEGGLVASSTYPGNLKFKNLLIANPNCIFVHGHTHFQFEDRDNGRGLLVYAPPGSGLNEGGCHSFHVPSLGSMTRISSSWTKEEYAAAGRSECWIVEAYSDGTRKFKGVNPYSVTDITDMTYTISK